MKWVLTFIVVWAGLCLSAYLGYREGYSAGQFDTLPSQSEVQEALGFPEPDGIIGPESRRVWNETIERRECDKYAAPIMEEFNKQFNKLYGLDEN